LRRSAEAGRWGWKATAEEIYAFERKLMRWIGIPFVTFWVVVSYLTFAYRLIVC